MAGVGRKDQNMNAIVPVAKNKGGRPKLSPNRCNLDLLEQLQTAMKERYGLNRYDPALALAEIACDQSHPIDIRVRAHSAILPYVRAQLKSVEISGPDGEPIEVKTSLIDVITASLDHADEEHK